MPSERVPRWVFNHLKDNIRKRELIAGGFEERKGGGFRPDATAWAIFALSAAGTNNDFLELSRHRLASQQSADGRIGISPNHPEAFWPTSLAVLAWQGSTTSQEAHDRAIHFLMTTSGTHSKRQPHSAVTDNTDLIGWSWDAKTYSWVEPTALALIALRKAGHGNHSRVAEGIELLLDRQLPDGGWNYGNKTVYGRELHPMPGPTGLALQALEGRVMKDQVKKSIKYLKTQVCQLHTPLTLSWSLLGLAAWAESPASSEKFVSECLERQSFFGEYDTSNSSLLLSALLSTNGLLH